jgi:phospholipid-binding lipoprotein MlaA
MTGRWLRRTAVVVVVIGIIRLTPVFGDDVLPPPPHGDVSGSGPVAQGDGPPGVGNPLDSSAIDAWPMSNTDANLTPEALHQLVLKRDLSLGEFAQAPSRDEQEFDDEVTEYDPWERFNRKMFDFNQKLDRHVLKPVAKVWNFVVPDLAQQSLANAFDNIAMPRRLINSLFQLKMKGAGLELARFFLNISMGVGGFFDVATELGVPRSDEDTGQTLGYYGVGPGPYLVLPFLPPLTVRDGIGYGADGAMQPISYVAPFAATVGMRGGQVVNDRSLNLETFEEFEQMTFDLYSAVRNAYLQRRQRMIQE